MSGKMIQIRNVPESLHRKIALRAKREGTTITLYIQRLLEREMEETSTLDEVVGRIRQREKSELGEPVSAVLDRARRERERL